MTRIIPVRAAAQAWAEAAEYRRFRRLSQELIEAGDALSEARLRAGSGTAAAEAGAGKKGAARRRSRPKSTPKSGPSW